MSDTAQLLYQSLQCRRLALALTDPRGIEALLQVAQECEALAAGQSHAGVLAPVLFARDQRPTAKIVMRLRDWRIVTFAGPAWWAFVALFELPQRALVS